MVATLKISERGTVTLPKALRKRFAIKADELLIAEATEEGILLKPAVAYPIEIYTDKRIAEFEQADAELVKFLRKKKK